MISGQTLCWSNQTTCALSRGWIGAFRVFWTIVFIYRRGTPAGRELSPLESFTLVIVYEAAPRLPAYISCPFPPDMFHCSGTLCVSTAAVVTWRESLCLNSDGGGFVFPSNVGGGENQRLCGRIYDTSAPSSGRTGYYRLLFKRLSRASLETNKTLIKLLKGCHLTPSHILRLWEDFLATDRAQTKLCKDRGH